MSWLTCAITLSRRVFDDQRDERCNNFSVVGKINVGEKVELVKKEGEWVQIKPTANCWAFVNPKYLRLGTRVPTPTPDAPHAPAFVPREEVPPQPALRAAQPTPAR